MIVLHQLAYCRLIPYTKYYRKRVAHNIYVPGIIRMIEHILFPIRMRVGFFQCLQ